MRIVVLALIMLAGCGDAKLSDEEIAARSQECMQAGMIPRVHYYAGSNEIKRVTCETK